VVTNAFRLSVLDTKDEQRVIVISVRGMGSAGSVGVHIYILLK
jgi:hypothetical protein